MNTEIKKILVIDDTQIIRDLLVEVLRADGYDVAMAKDGVEAVEMVREQDYDLVFCDVHMPRQNGLETARQIMELSETAKLIMTDSYPDKLAKQAKREGAFGYICKPFDLGELRLLLQRVERGETLEPQPTREMKP
ncbi:MAG: response regulator [bacterium]